VIHYHGTPITPRETLLSLAGRVSWADPRDVSVCHRIGQSVMLDNGAYTFWRRSRKNPDPESWRGYMNWAEGWLEFQTTWAVIPDVIDGSEADNDGLLVSWFQRRLPRGAPVWHLHESLERLKRLAHGYDRVCFGSSGQYANVGDDRWRRRVDQAFNAIADDSGRVNTWVHMLRGMSLSGSHYPFASVDSTDVARNHNREQNTARLLADRWDGLQCPARWSRVPELRELEVA
jgi:hypothetical protein